jgi:chromatin segregation and condensation protein Rec8/ScpA/Scc1 (kleisin family)
MKTIVPRPNEGFFGGNQQMSDDYWRKEASKIVAVQARMARIDMSRKPYLAYLTGPEYRKSVEQNLKRLANDARVTTLEDLYKYYGVTNAVDLDKEVRARRRRFNESIGRINAKLDEEKRIKTREKELEGVIDAKLDEEKRIQTRGKELEGVIDAKLDEEKRIQTRGKELEGLFGGRRKTRKMRRRKTRTTRKN